MEQHVKRTREEAYFEIIVHPSKSHMHSYLIIVINWNTGYIGIYFMNLRMFIINNNFI